MSSSTGVGGGAGASTVTTVLTGCAGVSGGSDCGAGIDQRQEGERGAGVLVSISAACWVRRAAGRNANNVANPLNSTQPKIMTIIQKFGACRDEGVGVAAHDGGVTASAA